MNNEHLAPCPFCATQATMLTHGVACDSCLCHVERAKGQSDEDLAATWNRRATPSANEGVGTIKKRIARLEPARAIVMQREVRA